MQLLLALCLHCATGGLTSNRSGQALSLVHLWCTHLQSLSFVWSLLLCHTFLHLMRQAIGLRHQMTRVAEVNVEHTRYG